MTCAGPTVFTSAIGTPIPRKDSTKNSQQSHTLKLSGTAPTNKKHLNVEYAPMYTRKLFHPKLKNCTEGFKQ